MKMQEFILNLNEETVMTNKPRSIFFFHLMLADQKQILGYFAAQVQNNMQLN